MNHLPRNMNLKAFDAHRADFTCKHEADANPPFTAEADALFQQGMAVTSYDLVFEQRDYAKAAQLWREAAGMGHWKAAMNLAGLHESGLGGPQDSEQAVLLVEGLMKQGVPAAFDKMGTYHQRGIGVKGDASRAYAFWQLAADMGSSAAQAFLGSKLDAAYDNPGRGFWGNREIGLKMLECGFAQGNGDAAYELAQTITGSDPSLGEDNARALRIYHEGVKLGCKDCARALSVNFHRPVPLTGNTIDAARSDRYRLLRDALELNPDLRFPNLDKVLPLPPAELPTWDGKRQTLIDAAKPLVAAPVVKPTPGSQRTGRAHIPDGHVLPAHPTPAPIEMVGGGVVMSQYERTLARFTGYWLPQLMEPHEAHHLQWDRAQVPQRYAQGEAFERNREGLSPNDGRIMWHYAGLPVKRAARPPDPRIAQGIARATRVPQPLLFCKGMLPCPRTGVWGGQVSRDHPLARLYNRWDRFAYVEKGQPFPDPRSQHIAVAPHEVKWLWLDNANQRQWSGITEVTLSDLHDAPTAS